MNTHNHAKLILLMSIELFAACPGQGADDDKLSAGIIIATPYILSGSTVNATMKTGAPIPKSPPFKVYVGGNGPFVINSTQVPNVSYDPSTRADQPGRSPARVDIQKLIASVPDAMRDKLKEEMELEELQGINAMQGLWHGYLDVDIQSEPFSGAMETCQIMTTRYHMDLTLRIGSPEFSRDAERLLYGNGVAIPNYAEASGTLTYEQPTRRFQSGCQNHMAPNNLECRIKNASQSLQLPISLDSKHETFSIDLQDRNREAIEDCFETGPNASEAADDNQATRDAVSPKDGPLRPEFEPGPFPITMITRDRFVVYIPGKEIDLNKTKAAVERYVNENDLNALANQGGTGVRGEFVRGSAASGQPGSTNPYDQDGGENNHSPNKSDDKHKLGKLLAALLAYLALLLPGILKNPQSSDFASLIGTLLGSLEALKGLGLGAFARQTKLGGFVGGAIAEAIEWVRLYKTSEADGESAATTAARLGISAISDIVAFVAAAAVTEAAIGVAITAVPIIGAVGAAVVAVGGAALITYGISSAATAVKTWATGVLNNAIGK